MSFERSIVWPFGQACVIRDRYVDDVVCSFNAPSDNFWWNVSANYNKLNFSFISLSALSEFFTSINIKEKLYLFITTLTNLPLTPLPLLSSLKTSLCLFRSLILAVYQISFETIQYTWRESNREANSIFLLYSPVTASTVYQSINSITR